MSPEILIGQQSVCLCVLLIMAVSIFFDRQREHALDLLMCAAVTLMCALAFSYACVVSRADGTGPWEFVAGTLSAALGLAAAVEMGLFFRLWKPLKESRLSAVLLALLPLWAALPGCTIAGEPVLLLSGETLSLLTAWALYQKYARVDFIRQAREIESKQAMLFQWQMQPHFLFNTMSSIRELMGTNPALATVGLDNLAGYLRKNLDALTLDRMIPFEQELTHIEQYVMLEKMNPANQFQVVYDVQVIDFFLPALTVQPLVENAIRHGVRSLGSEGMVFVTTEPHGKMIRIIVEDNGRGFARDATEQQKTRVSHGLENVRRRLETQCGGSLHIYSDENKTRLVLLIPKEGTRA